MYLDLEYEARTNGQFQDPLRLVQAQVGQWRRRSLNDEGHPTPTEACSPTRRARQAERRNLRYDNIRGAERQFRLQCLDLLVGRWTRYAARLRPAFGLHLTAGARSSGAADHH